jgi:hypothetical protein
MAKYERYPAKLIGRRQWAFSDSQLRQPEVSSMLISSIGLGLQYRRQSDAETDRNCKGASEAGPSCLEHPLSNIE